MTGNKLINNLILLIVAVALVYFGYRWLGKPTTTSDAGLEAEGFADGVAGTSPSDEFLTTLTGLQELNLRGEVFADPVFQDLRDSNTVLVDQTPGRVNPFAPVNFDVVRSVAPQTTSTSSATSTTN